MTSTGLTRSTRAADDRRAWVIVAVLAVVWGGLYWANPHIWDRLLFDVIGLDRESHVSEGIHFFLLDMVKIALLLTGVIFAVAVVRTFITVERTREVLGGRRLVVGFAAAAVLGVATPFCSCSAVPVFIGFVAAGVPLGMTMTFLIASPLVNEVAVVLVGGSFGWDVAGLYIATGLTVAIAAGVVIHRLGLEKWVEPFVYEVQAGVAAVAAGNPSWSQRFAAARAEVRDILKRIWPYLLVGIGIGAAIHGWAPEDFFARYAGPENPLAVPVAVVLGIPLYSNAAGAIPLIEALHAKGVALGTSLAFLMSVVALSLPEAVLLRRVLRPRLLATFIGVVAVGILGTGFLFNAIL